MELSEQAIESYRQKLSQRRVEEIIQVADIDPTLEGDEKKKIEEVIRSFIIKELQAEYNRREEERQATHRAVRQREQEARDFERERAEEEEEEEGDDVEQSIKDQLGMLSEEERDTCFERGLQSLGPSVSREDAKLREVQTQAIGWCLIRAEINNATRVENFLSQTLNTTARERVFQQQRQELLNPPSTSPSTTQRVHTAEPASNVKATTTKINNNPFRRSNVMEWRKTMFLSKKDPDDDIIINKSLATTSAIHLSPGIPPYSLLSGRPVRSFDGIPASDAGNFMRSYERYTAGMSQEYKKLNFGQYLEGAAQDWFDALECKLKQEEESDDQGRLSSKWNLLIWDELKQLFAAEYMRDKNLDFMSLKQKLNESGTTFIYKALRQYCESEVKFGNNRKLVKLLIEKLNPQYQNKLRGQRLVDVEELKEAIRQIDNERKEMIQDRQKDVSEKVKKVKYLLQMIGQEVQPIAIVSVRSQ